MSRWYKPSESAIGKDKEALPNTQQRLQVSLISGDWSVDDVHERVKTAFPDQGVDYTVFGDILTDTSHSVRCHRGTPVDIVRFGVDYGAGRTYDDIIIDARDTPTTTYWFDDEPKSRRTERLQSLERLLTTTNVSRLGRTNSLGRYLSPYQRDITNAS